MGICALFIDLLDVEVLKIGLRRKEILFLGCGNNRMLRHILYSRHEVILFI